MNLLKEYIKSLKMVKVEEPLDLYFYRIISFIFVKIIYPLPITPNQLSVAALIMGAVSGVYYAFGTAQAYFTAGLFYAAYYLFDLSDGQVARLKKNGTRLGRIIDGISDYVTHLAVYIGLGIGVSANSGDVLGAWLLVGAALISLLVHVVLFDYYRNRYLEYAFGKISLYGDDLKELQNEYNQIKKNGGNYPSRCIYFSYFKYLSMQQILTGSSKSDKTVKRFDQTDFLKRNKLSIRLWVIMGSSLHITLLIITSFINRIDIYLYGILTVINLYAFIMLGYQIVLDKKTKLKNKEVNDSAANDKNKKTFSK